MSNGDRENGYLQQAERAYETIPTNEEILNLLQSGFQEIKRELNFLAEQCASVYSELSRIIGGVGQKDESSEAKITQGIDYDTLARKIAELFPAQEYISPDYVASKTAEQILSSIPPFGAGDNSPQDCVTQDPEEITIERRITAADFRNMMKFDRSFLARLIQCEDEQKLFYGCVRTKLMSYGKVNSNFSWGSERFNFGRQTVARFKIRGKTLCLYLALDPAEYKITVYHHADVSANKSVAGTPMMVKIKSPLGAKKAARLVSEMFGKLGAIQKGKVCECDYAAVYHYETTEELIEEGLIRRVDRQ